MKKSILQFSVIAAIAASMTLTTSCSSDDSAEKPFTPEPMVLGVKMDGMNVDKGTTRSIGTVDANTWADGYSVQIYTKDADGNFKTIEYTTGTTGTTNESGTDINGNTAANDTGVSTTQLKGKTVDADAAGQFYWGSTTESKAIKAWTYGTSSTPATGFESQSPATEFDLTVNQSSDIPEFLYAYQTISYDDRETDYLVFSHQLALLEVTVVADKNSDALLTFGESKTSSQKLIPIKADFTPPTTEKGKGTWAGFTAITASNYNDGNYGYVTPRIKAARALVSTKYNTVYQGVVIPGDYTNFNLFVIEYDGATYAYKVDGTTDSAWKNITAGNKYNFTITIGSTGLSVNATIQPWTDYGTAISKDAVLQ